MLTASSPGSEASTPTQSGSASEVLPHRTSTSLEPSFTVGSGTTRDRLGLEKSADFVRFIDQDFAFYSHWYERLRKAADKLTPGLECIFFNADHNFTLQYPVLLSPMQLKDSEDTILSKVRVTSAFLDILIHRRIWNWHAIDYSTMQYAMFVIMRDIRGKSMTELTDRLRQKLEEDNETFLSNQTFRLHGMNGRQIHRLLARMTDYIETRSGMPSHYVDYAKRGGKEGFEIEHIWADHAEWHEDEFPHPSEFAEYRNRIGDLLLLPKSFNASYGDLPYKDKVEHYGSQNLLAWSLHDNAYNHNPGFLQFIESSGLLFQPHSEFRKADLDARQELYLHLAEHIWSPERITEPS